MNATLPESSAVRLALTAERIVPSHAKDLRAQIVGKYKARLLARFPMANVAVVKFRTIATSEVILADWKQGRLECLQNCLEDCRCNLQVATAFSQIAERCDRASFRLLIIPRLWPSNNSLSRFESSLNLVREITAPWVLKEVIVFDDDTKSLPLAEYCRVFAEGASEFLDSSSGSFAQELKEVCRTALSEFRKAPLRSAGRQPSGVAGDV